MPRRTMSEDEMWDDVFSHSEQWDNDDDLYHLLGDVGEIADDEELDDDADADDAVVEGRRRVVERSHDDD